MLSVVGGCGRVVNGRGRRVARSCVVNRRGRRVARSCRLSNEAGVRRSANRSGTGTSTVAAQRTSPDSPGPSTPRSEAGSTTTEPSTAPSCIPSQHASTNISSDGRCRSSNDCEANPPKHGDGSTLPVSASHNSSLTGTSLLQPNAGLWEPYDGRLSRTVLTEREVPSRHSPGPQPQAADPQITPDTQNSRVSLLGLPGLPAGGLRSGPALGADSTKYWPCACCQTCRVECGAGRSAFVLKGA